MGIFCVILPIFFVYFKVSVITVYKLGNQQQLYSTGMYPQYFVRIREDSQHTVENILIQVASHHPIIKYCF